MFNFINNFFRSAELQAVESSTSSDDGDHKKEQEQKKEEKKYLEQEEPDEVRIGGRPELTEEEAARNEARNLEIRERLKHRSEKTAQKLMEAILNATMEQDCIASAVTGWVDYEDEAHFEADMYVVCRKTNTSDGE